MNNRIMPSAGPLTLLKLIFTLGGIHPSRIGRVFLFLIRLTINYPVVLWERLFYTRQIESTVISTPPIFIIGHFRSGTSLIHKLMTCDTRWRYINEYELIFPYHSKTIERWFKPILQRIINYFRLKHPNFNNYVINLDDPNEDEALLVSLGAGWASYWSYIFPSHAKLILNKTVALDDEPSRAAWKSAYLFFLKRLVWKKGNQKLIIKSPPNSARIAAILELFPGARFIYLHRNPENVINSMKKIWKEEILRYFCFQKPDNRMIEHHIAEMYTLLTGYYQRDKHLIPSENLIEVQYEDLVNNPYSVIESIYTRFNLSMDELLKHAVKIRIEAEKDYRESKYQERNNNTL